MPGPPQVTVSTTSEFDKLWDDKGKGAHKNVTFWRPKPPDGWLVIGDLGAGNYDPNPNGPSPTVRVENDDPEHPVLKAPEDYLKIWEDYELRIWEPKPPPGYVTMGYVAAKGEDKPVRPDFRCVRSDYARQGRSGGLIWSDAGSGCPFDVSVYSIKKVDGDLTNCFHAQSNYDPLTSPVWTIATTPGAPGGPGAPQPSASNEAGPTRG